MCFRFGIVDITTHMVGSLKMNTTLEYSTRVVHEGDRRCKKSTLNDLAYLTPLRIPPIHSHYVYVCAVVFPNLLYLATSASPFQYPTPTPPQPNTPIHTLIKEFQYYTYTVSTTLILHIQGLKNVTLTLSIRLSVCSACAT